MTQQDIKTISKILDYLAEQRDEHYSRMRVADDNGSYNYHKGAAHAFADAFSRIENDFDGKLLK